MEEFLKRINFAALRDQKFDLLSVQEKMVKHPDTFTQQEQDSLEGILNLIDAIQDEAVDKYGYPEDEVFRLSAI